MLARLALGAAFVLAACGPDSPPTGVEGGLQAGSDSPLHWPPFTVIGRWDDAGALTYRIEGADGPLPEAELREAVEAAFSAWSRFARVGFQRAAEGAVPDVVLRWTTDEETRAFRDTSVATTDLPGPGCHVRFRRNARWGMEGGPSLATVALHEVGHVLGLGHVESPDSAMQPQFTLMRTEPGPGDVSGLCSLYGGTPPDSYATVGGLVLEHGGMAPNTYLRAVAPKDETDWSVFDTDGDGGDEVLIWSTGDVGHGGLTIYHFEPSSDGSKVLPPRLERTIGPVLGIAGTPMEVHLTVREGRRCLDTRRPDGTLRSWVFDDHGRPQPAPTSAGPFTAKKPQRGDLDTDGKAETVTDQLRCILKL